MFKKYSFLFFIAGAPVLLGGTAHAQNTPELNQTAPSGSVTNIIPPPLEIGADVNSRNTVTHYAPKVKMTNPNSIESALGNHVNKSIEYRDGNNQVYQSIIFSNSRLMNGQLRDLVQPVNTHIQRNKYSFLPFPRNASNAFQANAFVASRNYYLNLYPGEDYTSYSSQEYFSTSGYRETRNFAPGKSQVGQNRYTAKRTVSNNANQIRIWKLDGNGYPVSTTFYPANTLFGVQVTDQDGHITRSFKNKSGQLVLKQVQDGGTSYASTYYVYDDMGNLRYILPPKAIQAAGSGTLSDVVRNKLCFHYVYDDKGRLVAQSKPGQNGGLTQIVYDRLQRPVMRRTPKEKNAGQWEVTFYDHSGRAIATSLLNNSTGRIAWQDLFDNYSGATYASNNIRHYILSNEGIGQYPPETGITNNTMMSYTWYDNYSVVDPNNTVYNNLVNQLNFTADLLSGQDAETPERSLLTHGMVTGSKVRILPAPGIDNATTGDWKQTWNYYDAKGRLIYAESKDLYQGNPIHDHLTATQFNFSGNALLSKHILVNEKSKDGATEHTEWTKNQYDAYTGQLTRTYHKVDDGSWNTLAVYKYDDLGRLKRESLGDGGEVRDYDYNIRGQLTGINGHYAETGESAGKNTTFGESLKYDYGFGNPRYDGKISGMVWRGSGGTHSNALAYGYDYTPTGRLKAADFRRGDDQNGQVMKPAGWDNDVMDYTVSNLSYDKNGNIKSKDLMGPGFTANNVSTPASIDELTYAYAANSNRLTSVTDGITQNYGDGDFQDGHTSGADYAYDADGNLTKDLNKGISSVTYTWFDKPQKITFENGSIIRYSYTAAGNKVQEHVQTDESKTTDYIGNFVYENDKLQYASTSVGRTVWNLDTVKEEYFVKDHLGNVRSIIDVYHYPIMLYLASYEIASAQLEGLFFDKVEEIRDDKPGSSDPEDTKAGRLNGAEPESRIGTSILVKVMAGDQVKLNVDNYYDGTYNQEDDQPVHPEDMLSSILSTLMHGEGGLGESESHNPDLVPKLFNPDNYAMANDLMHSEAEADRPKAFLNYVLFDENMQVVRNFTGAWQANGNGGWQTIGNDVPMTVPVNGYLAVYLSNATSIACESCMISSGDVYFDKLKIHFTRGNLKEENHYYPFGLPMAAIGGKAMGALANRQKYQSNEYIKDAGLNWMSFGARQYDPQIGRFLSVDPLAAAGGQDMLSPYHAMGNNPTNVVDPGGTVDQMSNALMNSLLASILMATPSTTIDGYTGGYSPEALKDMMGMGDYTTDAMDMVNWGSGGDALARGMSAALLSSTFYSLTGIGGAETISSSVICNLGPKGNDGPDGGTDGADNSNSSGNSNWFGMTNSIEMGSQTLHFWSSGYGDKITISQSQSVMINGNKGKFYNIDVGTNKKGSFQSISVNNYGRTMKIDLGNLSISGGYTFLGYHQSFGFSFSNGFGFKSESGYSNGHTDNTINIKYTPGLMSVGAAALGGLLIFQPELPATIIPYLSF